MIFESKVAPAQPVQSVSRPRLQRKCACGGRPGPSGDCSACAAKRRSHRPLQAKLAINVPGDSFEQEADRVADLVMSNRREAQGEARSRAISGLMRKTTVEPAPALVPPIVGKVLAQSGERLDSSTRSFMEAGFGHDFRRVRVHIDATAAESARAVHAAAYTVGHQISFDTSRYSPRTGEGRRLLAHELAHVVQQDAALAAVPRLQRVWQSPEAGTCDDVPKGVSLDRVIVEQEAPQSVTLMWSDGSVEAAPCSSGKGHCCVAPTNTEGVGCTETESRRDGSNCTAINTGAGHGISERKREHNGHKFWNTFVAARGIALHQHYAVTGRPLSHGCVRVQENTARRVFCGARQNATRVEVRGYARPRCDDPALTPEWEEDFRAAAQPTDGEPAKRVASIREHREMLRDAYGRTLTPEELGGGAAALGIPRCGDSAAMPTTEERQLSPNLETVEANRPQVAPSEIEDPFAEDPSLTATVPAGREILASGGFPSHLPQLSAALARAGNLAVARNAIRSRGRALWQAAERRAEAASADTDDRALYFTRLEGTRLIRQWSPAFKLSAEGRAELIQIYEDASRGVDPVASSSGGSAR